ncbi:alpha/beta hydrolase family esterase [Rhodoblastus sp.]|uniref:alpha/beta hydrolase family esterase n=1 Tax=Rhodoblastus sp. TaxID=1962975 RepID=UPI003F997AB2
MSPKWSTMLVAAFCAMSEVPQALAAAYLTIDSAGLARTALVIEHAPLKLARRPLVIVLHGENGNGARVRHRLRLESITHSAKPIFLYPDAIHGHWSDAVGAAATRDVAMLRDMTATLERRGLVNSRLIFLVGDSTGGAMAIRAVCAGLGPIAGLATIDTTMPPDLAATCAPPKPLAYIAIATGHSQATASPAALAFFAKSDGCAAGQSPAPLVVSDPRNRDVAYVERFSGCKAPVEQVRIIHDGKATSAKIGASDEGASSRAEKMNDAAHLVWAFLKKLGA